MRYILRGYNLDDLVKRLHKKNIVLTNIVRISEYSIQFDILNNKDELKAEKYIKNYEKLTSPTGKQKVKSLILANVGLLIAIFVGCIYFLYASNYIWQIKIYGANDSLIESIKLELKGNGIKIGALNHFSTDDIEQIMLNNIEELAQVSAIRIGTSIIINVSEKLVLKDTEYQPIRALYSGVVDSISLITGSLNVKKGDFVSKGDILVYPYNINSDGSKIMVEPKVEILGKIFVVGRCQLPKQETKLLPSGATTTEYRYKFKNTYLFCGKNRNSFANFETVVYNENITDVIPLNRERIIYKELVETTINHNFETEKQSLIEKSKDLALKSIADIEKYEFATDCVEQCDYLTATTTISFYGRIND